MQKINNLESGIKPKFSLRSSNGAASMILLILGMILIVVIIIIFVVIRLNAAKTAGGEKSPNASPTSQVAVPTPEPTPIYETNIGDIKFILKSAEDLGNILASKYGYLQSPHTTEKYIRVTLGVVNKGKINTKSYAWNLGNIVDSEGRNFVSVDSKAYEFLPNPNLCGAILKPEFEPTPCVRYYEVSKASKKLRLEVAATVGESGKIEKSYLDLLVIPR